MSEKQAIGWNEWYAYEDEHGSTEYDEIEYDTFESWALSGMQRDEMFPDKNATAEEFCDNMAYLAAAEQRHIPVETREEFLAVCAEFVARWNARAAQEADDNEADDIAGQVAGPVYVRSDDGDWYVQIPAENEWGFSLCDEDQSWPGGFGAGRVWQVIPAQKVPRAVRNRLDFLFDL